MEIISSNIKSTYFFPRKNYSIMKFGLAGFLLIVKQLICTFLVKYYMTFCF